LSLEKITAFGLPSSDGSLYKKIILFSIIFSQARRALRSVFILAFEILPRREKNEAASDVAGPEAPGHFG
jgi:hypothetical protein